MLNDTILSALPFDPSYYLRCNIDGSTYAIKNIVLHCKGSAKPLRADAHAWRCMCLLFKEASSSLCNSISGIARRICTTQVSSVGLSAILACHLVSLNKNPGIQPMLVR